MAASTGRVEMDRHNAVDAEDKDRSERSTVADSDQMKEPNYRQVFEKVNITRNFVSEHNVIW